VNKCKIVYEIHLLYIHSSFEFFNPIIRRLNRFSFLPKWSFYSLMPFYFPIYLLSASTVAAAKNVTTTVLSLRFILFFQHLCELFCRYEYIAIDLFFLLFVSFFIYIFYQSGIDAPYRKNLLRMLHFAYKIRIVLFISCHDRHIDRRSKYSNDALNT